MKNVTVTLDEDTAKRARVQAAERNMSLSRYIGEVLRKELGGMDEYEAAYRALRKRKPFPLKGSPEPHPKREGCMPGPSFVDANVFLYTQDRRDLAKHKRAEEWLDQLWRSALGSTASRRCPKSM